MATDIEQISRLLSRYCRAIDDRQFDEFGALLSEDCEFSDPSGAMNGRDAIVAVIQANLWPAGRHLTINLDIVVDGDQAHATSDWLWLDQTLTPSRAGRYFDDLRRIDGQWHICRRRLTHFDKQES